MNSDKLALNGLRAMAILSCIVSVAEMTGYWQWSRHCGRYCAVPETIAMFLPPFAAQIATGLVEIMVGVMLWRWSNSFRS